MVKKTLNSRKVILVEKRRTDVCLENHSNTLFAYKPMAKRSKFKSLV